MYTLEQLEQKNIKQLKEIGWQLNVLPEADRRCRQNWIDVIVGINPPLLQLLEASPGVEVDPVSEPIELALDEKLPSEEEARSMVAQYFISTALREIRSAPLPARVFSPGEYVRIIEVAESRNSQFCGFIGIVAEHNFNVWVWVELDGGGRKIVICRPEKLELIELVVEEPAAKQEPIEIQRQEPIENSTAVEVQAQEPPIIETVETNPSVEVEQVSEPIAPAAETSPGVEVEQAQQPIIETVETFPGVEFVTDSNRNNFSGFELVTDSNRNNFSGFELVIDSNRNNFSGVEVDQVQKAIEVQAQEAITSAVEIPQKAIEVQAQEPIAQVVENSPGVESDWHPILTGVTFSDRFLARYSPPQSEIIHFQSDIDGQLSLLDFEVQSVDEPPDPDDFESLDAFREAIARWDFEHNEVSPEYNEVNPEHNEVSPEHNEVSPEYNEPLQVSLDSFCLWAPCPHTWYSRTAPSEVMEFLRAGESSDTFNFFIPTFGALGDRSNRSDEPPDTGIYARWPKPKPPQFFSDGCPPSAGQTYTKLNPNASQTHTHCIAAGTSTQPARSPPGGDAM